MRSGKGRVLVVDDHEEMARLLADQLGDAGFLVEAADSAEAALALVRKRLFDVVLTDLRMDRLDGFDLLEAVRRIDPSVPVLIMTAFGAIDSAIEAIKRGAFHYLTKPFRLEEVVLFVERALADRQLRVENVALRRVAAERAGLGGMIGRSEVMRSLYDLVERVAESSAPVLVRGESGVGKELVARALHFLGPRRERPFVAVNCTSLPEALLESEVFGHVRGAYTGATTARRGLFVEADGGTLLLDEIGDMAPALQAKLLRTLEDGDVRAVGSDVSRRVDVRVVCATHQDLERKVKEGTFRADLFYRLNVVPIQVPPLRARTEDVPFLVEAFLVSARARNPRSPVERFSAEAIAALARRPWPGNVRELEHLVERLVIVSTKPIVEAADLATLTPSDADDPPPVAEAKTRLLPLRRMEDDYIAWMVEHCDGNKTRAAEILGIDVSTIHRRGRSDG